MLALQILLNSRPFSALILQICHVYLCINLFNRYKQMVQIPIGCVIKNYRVNPMQPYNPHRRRQAISPSKIFDYEKNATT